MRKLQFDKGVSLPPSHVQQNLLDVRREGTFPSVASGRSFSGHAAEAIVRSALNMQEVAHDGKNTHNYDGAWLKGESYLFAEIKSVRKGGKVVVYDWRLEKGSLMPEDSLVYLIAVHSCRGAKSHEEMSARMVETLDTVYALTSDEIKHLATSEPLRQVKPMDESGQNGYNRKGYCEGYRNIPLHKIKRLCSLVINHDDSEPTTPRWGFTYEGRKGSVTWYASGKAFDTIYGINLR